ncbi:MAG: knotted carbamoyltransferase YgeW [Deltaproteobacteria bacterium]|nr:MAG: knotted carbamoyltransferase YgeW [Deltaproteobacteria bacterium]
MDTSLATRLSRLQQSAVTRLHKKSLLLTSDWPAEQLEALLQLAELFEAADRQGRKLPLLTGELAYALFFDQSTRTKSAWAGASTRLGMNPVIVDGGSTQVSHGETAEETGAMLGMNSHALGVRHDMFLGEGNLFMREMLRGLDAYLEDTDDPRSVPMVNLQCDIDHPTQTLADLLWLREHFGGELQGKKIAVSWAYSPSYAKPLSVPQGLIMLLPRFGMNVSLAHPKGYELTDSCLEQARQGAQESGGTFEVVDEMSPAFADAHVVYPKSWGPRSLMLERVDAHRAGQHDEIGKIEQRALALNKKHQGWICDAEQMARTIDKKALYMHCLPADIGAEVSAEVYDRYRTLVAREANKKIYAIMALLAAAKIQDLPKQLETVLG